MERVWQWAWDRYASRYAWAVYAISCVIVFPIYGALAVMVVAFENSDRYLAGIATAAVATTLSLYVAALPNSAPWRGMRRWAAGDHGAQHEALQGTYTYARLVRVRAAVGYALCGGAMSAAAAAISGAGPSRVVQWAIFGAIFMTSAALIAIHSYPETFLRPARLGIIAGSTVGDSMPRPRPGFGTWSNLTLLTVAFTFTLTGALCAGVVDSASTYPGVAVVIAAGFTLFFAAPITMACAFAPSLRPIRDLTEGTARVAAGDYSQRLPVVQDDDLGVLVASFNRMQAGLAERQRLQAAFGSYVDPGLAARLLEQGDDLFRGERRVVTVMFVDIRDFTPFAETHTAEETVAHLNAVFEIIVRSVTDVGGHVNKYLGDGALAVFGAPNSLTDHADAALVAALRIRDAIADRFAGRTRIGIGVNTGEVIAGTVGGAGKLEFTLIGDTVNVAGRIEQLTKTTGDTILLTKDTLDALVDRPVGLVDRGTHALKGKATSTVVYTLDPAPVLET